MKIVVAGLGEMGASLALAVKRSRPDDQLVGVDSDPLTRQQALELQVVDAVSADLAAVASTADVIVLATPVRSILKLLNELAELPLKSDVLITDTGSTKVQVMQAAKPLLDRQIEFVGGHAMAGSQQAGITAGRVNLYQQRPYFLVAESKQAEQRAREFLAPLEADFKSIDAVSHDMMMAHLSDLPHVAAAALVNATQKSLLAHPELPQLAAGGFKDTTRIGGADPEMWTDVLMTNQAATLAAISELENQLALLKTSLQEQDAAQIYQFFATSKKIRAQF